MSDDEYGDADFEQPPSKSPVAAAKSALMAASAAIEKEEVSDLKTKASCEARESRLLQYANPFRSFRRSR